MGRIFSGILTKIFALRYCILDEMEFVSELFAETFITLGFTLKIRWGCGPFLKTTTLLSIFKLKWSLYL